MTLDIIHTRLHNQQLTSQTFEKPEDLVAWFGAVQAQDFAAAKWALSLRIDDETDSSIEQAFNDGKILRTHIMRPTWHFVTPSDIRWILALTSPRVHRFNGYYYRQSGLDKTIFEKSNEVIKKALQKGKQLTRNELHIYLDEAKIPTKNLGLSYTIMQAELDGIICSGPRRGKQFTYMLLDERAPHSKQFTHEEALAELTKRYFQSHGPAQAQDFSWWSGLTLNDAQKGIELNKHIFQTEEHNKKKYWFVTIKNNTEQKQDGFLVPGFDEYFIAYKDRSDILDSKYAKYLNHGGGMFNGAIVINGKMVGEWKRVLNSKNVMVTIKLFEKITNTQQHTLKQQVKRFGEFLNMPVVINV
ncbi:MAG TPA: winged helix DNA-binding domain-containing protein [Candidatus Sulfotelmatobacter sp.]|jgi:hypothetical protein|nr:winged helix DNA-binding domain-containing protein [Candidatus Sulfotelmatobacter sp.]